MIKSKNGNFQIGNLIAIPWQHHSRRCYWFVKVILIDDKKDEYDIDFSIFICAPSAKEAAKQGIEVYKNKLNDADEIAITLKNP